MKNNIEKSKSEREDLRPGANVRVNVAQQHLPAAPRTWQPKVFVKTFGCQMNVRDSEVVAGLLTASGYQITDNKKEADVVIINTCSVRQHAEDRVWSEVGALGKKKCPRPLIGIIGCMAQNYKEGIFLRANLVDFVVGPSDIQKIPEIIQRLMKLKNVIASSSAFSGTPRNDKVLESLSRLGGTPRSDKLLELKIWETESNFRPQEIYQTGFYQDKDHAYVVISEGCSNFCSYCVVPYTRGPLKHRKHQDILAEINQAVDQGLTKLTLLGQNVNAYKDNDVNFSKLVELVNSVKGLKEFTFLTSHPKDTTIESFKAIADLEKLKKALHLPVQSGSDKILKLMNRGYSRKIYLDLVKNYRKIVKGGLLSTDIIVGFSGETKEDFLATLDLVKEAEFNSAYIFKYSPRPNTEALKFEDDVPKEEKEKRHKVILELQKKISKEKR